MTTPLPRARRRRRSPWPTMLGVLALVGLTAFIAFGNLGKSLEYFVTPTEYEQQRAQFEGRPLRIGGLVKAVQYNPQTLDLKFNVTDGGATFPVQYRGAVSDLFKENQGVVVRGTFQGNTFHATDLVVKHSEEYHVPQTQAELKKLLQENQSQQ
ncbi:cytochrome c-type biogenesis protein CcmE [Deinococcus aerius]|uniref:Cytochrome c-type biogenesis protein CcmE n=2 Tax=Deinococcus TaxID=1298 RepID=A0A2I9CSH4_9DEIO|nr:MULTISPECIES: cytochrome c maturation protein CcmE [Deinococcus]MBB5293927.1 cytochrome c-type biogenesis protein CcmE [Deinococcus metallilatus]QBY07137.1 cytochrome c maturation protein CcmE [Deinococcus metallilatus]RXJ14609.1 cytochrome c maturation protein CcmE [Deinococcus metallilatus]TLK30729.1 cytochrome c maturation protein CcmE [Deinococcus metallilatus]GBF04613.1 cytochrome c-type biogenesis protein CcmE [Deinococcus aerius]